MVWNKLKSKYSEIESLHVATDKNLGEESRTFEWITGSNGSSQLKEV